MTPSPSAVPQSSLPPSSPIREPDAPARINFSWLIKLRWGAACGQLITIAVVESMLGISFPLGPLTSLIAIELVLNLAYAWWLKTGHAVNERGLALTIAGDIVVLTGLLYFTGGSFNPFSFLFLVNLALAAVVLPPAWTWSLVTLALACSGALFYGPVWLNLPSDHSSHQDHMQMHLQGMWIAFAVAATFIVYFVAKVRRALALREGDLERQRLATARNEKLASLATLSAGAAHELATPLGTIAITAREIERQAESGRVSSLEDVRLIREQVERCRTILEQMAVDAGESLGEEPKVIHVRQLVEAAVREAPPAAAVTIVAAPESAPSDHTIVKVPHRAMTRALAAIIKNAHEASTSASSPIEVQLSAEGSFVRISVHDHGSGIPADIIARVGEPFFTTKAPGRGMGLGLFLTRSLVEKVGGALGIESDPQQGTRVFMTLPLATMTRPSSVRQMTAPAAAPVAG